MDQAMTIDPYLVGAVSIILVLALCLGVMFAMRDRHWLPPSVVTRSVWCEARRQTATVEFRERTHTGITFRSVQSCSLRPTGGRCGEYCRYSPTAELHGQPRAVAGERSALP